MRLSFVWGVVLALLSGSQAHAELRLVIDQSNISPDVVPALEQFIGSTAALLPPHLLRILNRKVTVHFVPLDSNVEIFFAPPCTENDVNPGQIRGVVRQSLFQREEEISDLWLHSVMIPEIVRGPVQSQPLSCGHKSLYELAQATLIHELGHLYDFSLYQTPERRRIQERCHKFTDNSAYEGTPEAKECENEVMFGHRAITDLPSFTALMNWKQFEPRNTLRNRSPDPYEFTSIQEAFAVQFEYYILDPAYSCRSPVEYNYFKNHFSYSPAQGNLGATSCTPNREVKLVSGSADLDPARIYQVHFLYASRGEEFISRFGHAMFRLIVCAPNRKEVGPACLNDIGSHVVVSFRANEGESRISPWKGLTGGYPSQMFLYPFYPHIINEYTVDQNRDLVSVPLPLSEESKIQFINRVLELHWGYQSKYYFFSNNCASEALHLLQGALVGSNDSTALDDLLRLFILTPVGLYEELVERHWIDPSSSKIFPSAYPSFESTYQKLKAAYPKDFKMADFSSYSEKTLAHDRKLIYDRILKRITPSTKEASTLANRFFVLESYLLRVWRIDFLNRVQGLLTKTEQSKTEYGKKLSRLASLQSKLLTLHSQAVQGYGIPLISDTVVSQVSTDSAQLEKEIIALKQDIMNWASAQFSDDEQEVNQIGVNRSIFLKDSLAKN